MKTVIFLLLILTFPVFSQVETTGKDVKGTVPLFYYDMVSYRSDSEGKNRVDVYVEVPYEGIQFVKSDQGFTANYSITVSFFSEDKSKLITEKTWTESVSSRDFGTTTSRHNYYLSVRSLEIPPMKYHVRCEVVDQDSKKNYIREDKVNIKNIAGPLALSDLLLVSKQVVVNGEKKIIPNISRNVASQKEGIGMYYEVYSDTSRSIILNYVIIDGKSEPVTTQTLDYILKPGTNQIHFTMNNAELNMGEYAVAVQLMDSDKKVVAQSEKKFVSRWVGIPASVQDLDKAVEQMVYIAKDSELDHIKDAESKEEKITRYLDYWKSKDPSPSTEENEVFEEYYRRIGYANDHFKHYLEGWRTDMGMIYVTLGPPSNVERHPFEFDSKPYEVWDYYEINRTFVFVDQTGFGDYRLITPVYGNWWHYRP